MTSTPFFDLLEQRLQNKEFLGSPVSRTAASGVPEFYKRNPWGAVPALDPCVRFKEEFERSSGEVSIVSSLAEVSAIVRGLVADNAPLVTWAKSEFKGWDLEWLWQVPGCLAGEADASTSVFRDTCFKAAVGITTVDFVVANTGSLALKSGPGRPRMTSLLPPLHIALVKASQVKTRMGEVFPANASRESMPSSLQFISGPSRTSDIENDHTIGVHGPKRVLVLLWKN